MILLFVILHDTFIVSKGIRNIILKAYKSKMEKKIAIPTRDNMVDCHFEHCENYTIYSVDTSGHFVNKESLTSPQDCGYRSNIASILPQKGVNVMLCREYGEWSL